MHRTALAALISLCTILTGTLEAQEQTGRLRGTVLNAVTKEPIVGASILLNNGPLGAATDADGGFDIAGIPVGSYQVKVTAVGFMPVVKTDVVITNGRPAVLAIDLAESVLEFEGVTVTTDFFQKNVESPVSVQTLGAEEIRRLPGGLEDVVRAVSILPGVAQVQAGRNDLIVRGGAPSENLFVIDNIEVPNINHFGTQGASGGPLSFINLDYVSETSFRSGGFGAQYGDKLSSVLTIGLKDGRTDRIGGKAMVAATQFGLNLEGPTGDDGSFIFSARRSYLDFIFKAAGFGFVPEYWDFLGKSTFRLSEHDRLTIEAIAALDNVKQFNDTEKKRFDNSRVLSNDQTQAVGGISWRHLLGNGYTTVTLGQSYVDFFTQQNDSLLVPIFTNTSYEYESSLRADLVYQLSKHAEVSAGVQGKIIRFASAMRLRPFATNLGGAPLAVDAASDTTAYKAAAYLQYSMQLGRLRTTAGIRADHFSAIDRTLAWSPRLTASYAVDELTTVTASIGRYTQAPSMIWLVSNPSVNRKLKHLTATQIVAGIDHLLASDLKVSLEVYAKRYLDYPASLTRTYLVMANTGAGFGGAEEGFASFGTDPLSSDGTGRARGIEFFIQKKASETPYYGLVSVSYNLADFTAMDGIERPGSFDQRWIVNAGGGYIFDEKWEASMKFRFATGRPYTPFNADGTQDPSRYNSARIDVNHSLDLRIDRRWAMNGWVLAANLDIQNIYNRKPVDAPRYNARLKQIENTGSIGILPSIGISAEF
ncbi:MAG: TonB-dependent receptor [Acidobacteriota bacterium]